MGQNRRWRRETKELGKSRGGSSRLSGGPTIVLLRLGPLLWLWGAHSELAVVLCGLYEYPPKSLRRDYKACIYSHSQRHRGHSRNPPIPASSKAGSNRPGFPLRKVNLSSDNTVRGVHGHQLFIRGSRRAPEGATSQILIGSPPHAISRR